MAAYEPFVKQTLNAGAYVILDCHNYARFNGKIIGEEGGPSTDSFAGMWATFAKKYADNSKIIYGLMSTLYLQGLLLMHQLTIAS